MALWTPSSYTAGLLKEWHDPSNSANITQSGGVISQDNDLSGNSNHNTATSTAQPTYTTSAINSLNAETFSSTTQQYFTGVLNYSTLTTFGIIFLVSKTSSTSLTRSMIGAVAAGGLQWRINASPATQSLFKQNIGVLSTSSSAVPAAPAIVAMTYTPSTGAGTFRLNGTADGTMSTGAQTFTSTAELIGKHGNNTTEFFDGIIAERIHIAGNTLSDIQLAEGYLAWKWGTVSSLDASHPYKSAAPGASPFMFPRSRHYVRR